MASVPAQTLTLARSPHHCALPHAKTPPISAAASLPSPNLRKRSVELRQNFKKRVDARWSGSLRALSGGGGVEASGELSEVSSSSSSVQEEEEEEEEEVGFDISRLERYTERVQNEVLRVHAVVDDEEDQVLIFKGFSSSLMRSTAYDPAEPVLPSTARIQAIDRIRGPYDPSRVRIIKGGRGLSWPQFQKVLKERGL